MLGVGRVGSRMIKAHPTEHRMRPLDRSTYGVPAIVSSRHGTRLCRTPHANDDPEARPATFQVIAGDADHFAAGIQQRTAGVVTPSL
jgi:hypothetical protein